MEKKADRPVTRHETLVPNEDGTFHVHVQDAGLLIGAKMWLEFPQASSSKQPKRNEAQELAYRIMEAKR